MNCLNLLGASVQNSTTAKQPKSVQVTQVQNGYLVSELYNVTGYTKISVDLEGVTALLTEYFNQEGDK